MLEYMLKFKFEEIAGIIALFFSFVSILYSYKGIKHSKYVEIITGQRIRWIDVLRKDFSKILTLAILLRRFNDQADSAKEFEETDEFYNLEPEERLEAYKELQDIKTNKKMIIKEATNRDTINTIELAILKLNENDDKDLIEKLEILKTAFLIKDYKPISDDFVYRLRILIKKLLKNEWEKVKKEVRKGGILNGKRRKNKENSFWS